MAHSFKKMTQVGFFKVCDAMRTHREDIDKLRTTQEVLAFLREKTGETVAKSSWPNICEAAGYRPASITRAKSHSDTSNSRRVLTNAIIALYEKLGERVPDTLANLYGICNEKLYQHLKPVPVASVPKPTTLSIAK